MYDELVKRLRSEAVYLPEKFSKNAELLDVLMKAADAIEGLSHAVDQMTKWRKNPWISVTERLPEEEESVFVVRKFLGVKGQVPPSTYTEIAYRIGDRWVADSDEYKIARHRHTDPLYWMPLPEPPTAEEGE